MSEPKLCPHCGKRMRKRPRPTPRPPWWREVRVLTPEDRMRIECVNHANGYPLDPQLVEDVITFMAGLPVRSVVEKHVADVLRLLVWGRSHVDSWSQQQIGMTYRLSPYRVSILLSGFEKRIAYLKFCRAFNPAAAS